MANITDREDRSYWQEGVDLKALLVSMILNWKRWLVLALTGAAAGSGLHLILAVYSNLTPEYYCETKYYVDFPGDRLDARDYYNDYTWNDVLATDPILGRAMERLDGFDRKEVEEMLNADILSDVRYLTVTVTADGQAAVERVSGEISRALEEFGIEKREFNSIEKIKDSGVMSVRKALFSWRMCLFFALAFVITAIFWHIVRFIFSDVIYTKRDIFRYFNIIPLGIRYRSAKMPAEAEFPAEKSDKYQDKWHDNELCDNLNRLGKISEVDVCEGFGGDEYPGGIILLIPFARATRQQTDDIIFDAMLRGIEIKGAVLTEADRNWMRLYYGDFENKKIEKYKK